MGNTDTIQVPIFTTGSPEYEADFHAWSVEQASRLRLLRVPGLDVANIAEEIESLARRDKRELLGRSAVLLAHLLKWRYQPDRRGTSWRLTILEQRQAIDIVLNDSPTSLRPTLSDVMTQAYTLAVRNAALETELALSAFPAVCEWTPSQILSDAFLPDA